MLKKTHDLIKSQSLQKDVGVSVFRLSSI